jgi:rsbT co-antagonist protein RsbR
MSHKQDFSDFEPRVGEVLMVLSDIAAGDYQSRCSPDLPVDHPLGALFIGVNEMIDSLQAESMRREAYQRELEEKLATIQSQRTVIRRLSTPIIEVWDGVLCLTVIGLFDKARNDYVVADLLDAVVSKEARCVIIDVTGAEIPDALTAELFVRLVKAVRLLGARCMLTGISSRMAASLVEIGTELQNMGTYPNLRAALKAFLGA